MRIKKVYTSVNHYKQEFVLNVVMDIELAELVCKVLSSKKLTYENFLIGAISDVNKPGLSIPFVEGSQDELTENIGGEYAQKMREMKA